jgi:hypothetical protein
MNANENQSSAPTRLVPIKNGRGEVKGYIQMFWSRAANGYVSVPSSDRSE